jgi:hypothetical protein
MCQTLPRRTWHLGLVNPTLPHGLDATHASAYQRGRQGIPEFKKALKKQPAAWQKQFAKMVKLLNGSDHRIRAGRSTMTILTSYLAFAQSVF